MGSEVTKRSSVTAEFDTIVHEILLEHLRLWAEIQGNVLASCLSGITFSVELFFLFCFNEMGGSTRIYIGPSFIFYLYASSGQNLSKT